MARGRRAAKRLARAARNVTSREVRALNPGGTSHARRAANVIPRVPRRSRGRALPMGQGLSGAARYRPPGSNLPAVIDVASREVPPSRLPVPSGNRLPTRVGGPGNDRPRSAAVAAAGRRRGLSAVGRAAAWGAAGMGGIGLGYALGPNSGSGRGMTGPPQSMYGSSGAGGGRMYG